MKNIKHLGWLAYIAAFILLPLGAAQAQDEEILDTEDKVLNEEHDRIIKFRPLDLGQVSLAFEKLRSSRVSNELGISYIYSSSFKGSFFVPEEKKVNGIGIRMSQRHYTSKKKMAPFGFYHGPLFGYRLLIFEKNVFGVEDLPPSDPNYRFVGRLYQNSLDLGYQLGGQFQLGRHFTFEVGVGLGGRVKYMRSVGADELLTDNIIGHAVVAEKNSALFIMPLPQFNLSIGYSY